MFSCIKDSKQNPTGLLLKTDLEFSAMSEKEGMHKAFLAFFADSGVMLRDNGYPIVGKNSLLNLFANKAIVMFFFGDTTGAIKLLHEILNERPHLDSLWFILSDLYEKRGDIDAAFKAAYNCKRALQKSENPNPQNLADVEARMNVLRR